MVTSCLETDLDAGAYLEEVTSWRANLAYHAFTTQWRRHINCVVIRFARP